jgi:DNA-binding LytR/AlgR family response regulator
MKDYTQIFLENSDTPVITLQNLKSVCEKLPASQFVRIHRSFAVAIDKIEVVTRRELIIKNRYIPIGNNYWEELSSIIHQYS